MASLQFMLTFGSIICNDETQIRLMRVAMPAPLAVLSDAGNKPPRGRSEVARSAGGVDPWAVMDGQTFNATGHGWGHVEEIGELTVLWPCLSRPRLCWDRGRLELLDQAVTVVGRERVLATRGSD